MLNLSPLNQLFALLVGIGVAFFLLVIFLDGNKNFVLKNDWRDDKKTPGEK